MATHSKLLSTFESRHLKPQAIDLKPGYTVRVHQRIREGEKERIQIFEGLVIDLQSKKRSAATFTVRKISYGVGAERTFPINSPVIAKIEVVRVGKARRAKLGYIRDVSRKQRMKEDKESLAEIESAVAKLAEEKAAEEKAKQEAEAKAQAEAEAAKNAEAPAEQSTESEQK